MKRFLHIYTVCLASFLVMTMSAQGVATSDTIPLISDSTDAVAWYNAGNAYYRQHDMAQAVLSYERALHFDPSHADAAYNLSLCQAQLPDRFASPGEMFFISWAKMWIYGYTFVAWLVSALLLLALAAACFLVYRHHRRLGIRRVAFFAALVATFSCLLSLTAAALSADKFYNEHRAVAFHDTAVRSRSTRTAKPERILHIGTTVSLTGITTPDSLAACRLPDGTEMWIQQEDIQEVNPK